MGSLPPRDWKVCSLFHAQESLSPSHRTIDARDLPAKSASTGRDRMIATPNLESSEATMLATGRTVAMKDRAASFLETPVAGSESNSGGTLHAEARVASRFRRSSEWPSGIFAPTRITLGPLPRLLSYAEGNAIADTPPLCRHPRQPQRSLAGWPHVEAILAPAQWARSFRFPSHLFQPTMGRDHIGLAMPTEPSGRFCGIFHAYPLRLNGTETRRAPTDRHFARAPCIALSPPPLASGGVMSYRIPPPGRQYLESGFVLPPFRTKASKASTANPTTGGYPFGCCLDGFPEARGYDHVELLLALPLGGWLRSSCYLLR